MWDGGKIRVGRTYGDVWKDWEIKTSYWKKMNKIINKRRKTTKVLVFFSLLFSSTIRKMLHQENKKKTVKKINKGARDKAAEIWLVWGRCFLLKQALSHQLLGLSVLLSHEMFTLHSSTSGNYSIKVSPPGSVSSAVLYTYFSCSVPHTCYHRGFSLCHISLNKVQIDYS